VAVSVSEDETEIVGLLLMLSELGVDDVEL